ncbi:MAG: carboxylesterase family protein, partial [Alteraurantiacibacter sp.]|nr:carboxylesterase family protein [Alteraurantiacibacter sp.]
MANAIRDSRIVTTRNGDAVGLDLDTVELFSGIPFAKPPVGDLRWAPPQAPDNWTGLRSAQDVPPQCAQNRYLGAFAREGGSEDCLYLNVWRPKSAGSQASKLPVMVWIHGGALWCGTASDYNGSKLAAKGGVIVVTINYRLALLGMFAHPLLVQAGQPQGNFGLMDQQSALKWVQDNIAAFGGDPDNVTIFGESSGGTSVMSHVVSPSSKGLLHHSLAMSGAAAMIRFPHFGG